jgi:hypothetical protein
VPGCKVYETQLGPGDPYVCSRTPCVRREGLASRLHAVDAAADMVALETGYGEFALEAHTAAAMPLLAQRTV